MGTRRKGHASSSVRACSSRSSAPAGCQQWDEGELAATGAHCVSLHAKLLLVLRLALLSALARAQCRLLHPLAQGAPQTGPAQGPAGPSNPAAGSMRRAGGHTTPALSPILSKSSRTKKRMRQTKAQGRVMAKAAASSTASSATAATPSPVAQVHGFYLRRWLGIRGCCCFFLYCRLPAQCTAVPSKVLAQIPTPFTSVQDPQGESARVKKKAAARSMATPSAAPQVHAVDCTLRKCYVASCCAPCTPFALLSTMLPILTSYLRVILAGCRPRRPKRSAFWPASCCSASPAGA